ncbi:unnamed protein product [Rodentolepis nana]|uniref:Uncharacterized protein n=1 Tax=Rodentolepis nana TaxID=102285 RepID=A0A3P7RWY3_RODNA|nr:unnamed protein product [Rodentolepis nana]
MEVLRKLIAPQVTNSESTPTSPIMHSADAEWVIAFALEWLMCLPS